MKRNWKWDQAESFIVLDLLLLAWNCFQRQNDCVALIQIYQLIYHWQQKWITTQFFFSSDPSSWPLVKYVFFSLLFSFWFARSTYTHTCGCVVITNRPVCTYIGYRSVWNRWSEKQQQQQKKKLRPTVE